MSDLNKTILLVDDDPKVLELLQLTFSLAGYETLSATDGRTVFELIENYTIDTVILDIAMEGLDGYEICKRLKSEQVTQNMPVIFLTAKTEHHHVKRGECVGGDFYLTKPFSVDELLTITEIALKS